MVVRFDLEGDVVLLVEADHAGVVGEHADAPIVGCPAAGECATVAAKIVSLSMLANCRCAVGVAIGDSAGQRLVAAMLAPGLGDRFQFDVGRIAAQIAEIGRESSASRPATDRAGRCGSAAPGPRRPARGSARVHQLEAVGRAHFERGRTAAGRRPPARWRRWPAPWRPERGELGRRRPFGNQYLRSVRTASALQAQIGDARRRRSGPPGPSRPAWAARSTTRCTRRGRCGSANAVSPAGQTSDSSTTESTSSSPAMWPICSRVEIPLDQIAPRRGDVDRGARPRSAAARERLRAATSGWPASG